MKKFFKKAKILNVRNYYEMKKPEPGVPVPWRYVQVPGELDEPRLQVAVYHRWKAIKPPSPVLMIHGLTGNHKQFAPLVRHCNYPWGLLSLDLRGFGGSEKSPLKNDLIHHVEDIRRLAKFFHRPFFNVIAYDFGGAIALKAARLYPELIGCIVLVQSGRPNSTFSTELKNSFQEEIKLFTEVVNNKEEYFKNIFGTELDIDKKEFLAYNLKQIQGINISRVSKHSLENSLNTFEKEPLDQENLWYIQHPTLLIRSEFGFTQGSPNHYLTNKDVKDLEKVVNIKEVVTIKGSTHRDILFNHSNEVMNKAQNLFEKYDFERIIDKSINSMRTREEIERVFTKFYGKEGMFEYMIKK